MKNYQQAIMCGAIFLMVTLGYGFNDTSLEKPVADSAKGFAIVELFTSEGCSSCPAADALAAVISAENNKEVYFLSFHVDYWNQYGWKDVFSSNNYTARQQQYALFFKLNSIYTPQAVVNGTMELIGSDESKLRSAIKRELQNVPSVSVNLQVKAATRTVSVTCDVSGAVNSVLNIALVQKEAAIAVKKGENAGRTLKHTDIVRGFKKLAVLNGIPNSVTLYIPEGVSLKDLKVVAYVQNRDDYKMSGVAVKSL